MRENGSYGAVEQESFLTNSILFLWTFSRDLIILFICLLLALGEDPHLSLVLFLPIKNLAIRGIFFYLRLLRLFVSGNDDISRF